MDTVSYLKDKDSPMWIDFTEVVRRESEAYPPFPEGEKGYYVTDG